MTLTRGAGAYPPGRRMAARWESAGTKPRILIGGTVQASFTRAGRAVTEGWVSPLFDLAVLRDGAEAIRPMWGEAGREGRPRIMTGRYFRLGADAYQRAGEYIHHY